MNTGSLLSAVPSLLQFLVVYETQDLKVKKST